jgi:zona occludens toxin (predicted ATPase)
MFLGGYIVVTHPQQLIQPPAKATIHKVRKMNKQIFKIRLSKMQNKYIAMRSRSRLALAETRRWAAEAGH